jgi:protein involved in polysaccharide export with SLBB domain
MTVSFLLQMAVSGAVGKPGFVSLPPDVPLSEVITHAGGFAQNASLDKISVRRDGKELMKEDATRKAIEKGQTLAQLQIHSGDEIVVREDSHGGFDTGFKVLTMLIGIAGLYATLRH